MEAECPSSGEFVTIHAENGQQVEIIVKDASSNSTLPEISVVEQGLENHLQYKQTRNGLREANFQSSSNQVTVVLTRLQSNQVISFKGMTFFICTLNRAVLDYKA